MIKFDKEDDGRIIAEATEIPGAMVYGINKEEAYWKLAELLENILLNDYLRKQITLNNNRDYNNANYVQDN